LAERDWKDLSARQKTGILAGGAVQIVLLMAALVDIRRRSPDGIRDSKRVWTAVAFVNFAGPISYFLFGRRRQGRF
jgi:hypothetical protein